MSDAAGDRPSLPEVGSRGTETTLDLIVRVHGGDPHALDELIERYLPELRRWLSGRLPGWARQGIDTDDLVQDTLIQVFRKISTFEYRGDGALLAYLRQALMNRLRNQVRNAGRRPQPEEVDERLEASSVSPLEAAIGSQALQAYEAALNSLDPPDREAIIARIEMGLTYPELARALDKPSADAARMAVTRALVRLTEQLRHLHAGEPAGPSSRDA